MVEITCPYCDFSKDIPENRIPDKAKWAICPRCKKRFEIKPEGRTGDIPDYNLAGSKNEPGPDTRPWKGGPKPGFWHGIFQSLGQALFSPRRLFGAMDVPRGYSEPLAFGLLFGSIGTMLGLFWQFLLMPNRFIEAGRFIFGHFNPTVIFLVLILATPLFITFQLFIVTFFRHVCLILFRGGKQGFAGTFCVMSYSQATGVMNLVPFVGGFIGFFWRMIIQIIGLKEIHQTSYARVILAYFLPLALLFFFIFVFIILFIHSF